MQTKVFVLKVALSSKSLTPLDRFTVREKDSPQAQVPPAYKDANLLAESSKQLLTAKNDVTVQFSIVKILKNIFLDLSTFEIYFINLKQHFKIAHNRQIIYILCNFTEI